MCVSVVVTIRQRAESLSVRVGTDHFLVSHHPGGGVIHLGVQEQTVKRADNSTGEERKPAHKLKCTPTLTYALFLQQYFRTCQLLRRQVMFVHFSQILRPTEISLSRSCASLKCTNINIKDDLKLMQVKTLLTGYFLVKRLDSFTWHLRVIFRLCRCLCWCGCLFVCKSGWKLFQAIFSHHAIKRRFGGLLWRDVRG